MPVTKLLAFSLARKTAAPTSSGGSPKRAIGVWLRINWPRGVIVPSSLKSKTAILFSRIESGGDQNYANIEWRPFPGEKLGEIRHRCLGRRIGYDT